MALLSARSYYAVGDRLIVPDDEREGLVIYVTESAIDVGFGVHPDPEAHTRFYRVAPDGSLAEITADERAMDALYRLAESLHDQGHQVEADDLRAADRAARPCIDCGCPTKHTYFGQPVCLACVNPPLPDQPIATLEQQRDAARTALQLVITTALEAQGSYATIDLARLPALLRPYRAIIAQAIAGL